MDKFEANKKEQIMDILKDEHLESLGIIKDIDISGLISNVNSAKKRKSDRLEDITYGLIASVIIILQLSLVYEFGIVVTLIMNSILVSPLPVIILLIRNKKIKGGIRV